MSHFKFLLLIYIVQASTSVELSHYSHWASEHQKSTSLRHISVAQVPYQCLSSPISSRP